jgi:transcriptional regulator with PAS, ATPase and Fis domain
MGDIRGLQDFLQNPDKDQAAIIEQMERFGIIGQSPSIIAAFQRVVKAAKSNANILIEGESGTGKEIFAQSVHSLGARSSERLVKLNCAEIPENLMESELFGYEKGAFTGATQRKIGKFEHANHGSIFLDEISEMSLPLQSKMLRVIEGNTINRVGGLQSISIDVRIISATNRNLWQQAIKNLFREDLYYRLNVIYLHLPPLRERREDIPILINHFINKYMKEEKVEIESINEDVIKLFISFSWPGNVRQLKNVIYHSIIMSEDKKISIENMPQNIFSSLGSLNDNHSNPSYIKKDNVIITDIDLNEMERAQIISALEQAHWKISEAAGIMGIHRNTLTQKMKRLRIK